VIAYSKYFIDTRVRREAETIADMNEYAVKAIVPKEGETPRRYVLENVEVAELNCGRYRGKSNFFYLLSYLMFVFSAFVACTGLFLRNELDIVHVHNMPNFLVFAAVLPRLFGKKLILDVHDTVPETYGVKFGNNSNILFRMLCLEESLCAAMAHRIICVNQPQSEMLVQRGIPARKISIIMNVPQQEALNSTYKNNGVHVDPHAFNLVYHGTITKRLGIDLAVEALARLTTKIPHIQFYIFGIGNDYNECASLAERLGIEGRVHLKEPVPLYQLIPILRLMHMGVVSNRKNIATELMLPVKMLEYIHLNIPVVAPRLKTIQYYFADDMVNYFEPEDVDSLADTIYDAYVNESKRKAYAEKARNHIRQYEWDHYERALIDLYKSLS
jgi:glycosyltransferase involved in cell wall biosynthesis